MKKFYYSLFAAAAMLLATSCSQEEEMVQQSNGLATFSVALNGATSARAAGDGMTVDKLYYEVYEGQTKIEGEAYDKVVDMSDGEATVEIPLMKGHTYTIAFWAQNSEAGIYDAKDLKAISVDYTNATANNEKYDAFFKTIEYEVKAGVTTVELTRPFAQLNIGTTISDWETAKGLLQNSDPADMSTVTVADLANSFNVFTGEATGNVDVTFAAASFNGENFTLNNVTYKNLAMNYLLVPGDNTEAKTTTTVEVTFQNANVEAHSFEVLYVPVERNYRTNIVGNLFTQEGDFEVVVKPGFNEPAILYPELLLAAANGGTVTLDEDVTLEGPLAVNADMVLNIAEGKTLTGSINVADGVSLTVTGGAINNKDENTSGIVSNGDLTLNDVEITSARHALRIESGTVVINGGIYKVNPTSKMTLHALNVGDGTTSIANVTIKGGTFIGPKGTIADSGAAVAIKAGSTVTIEGGDFSGGKNNTLSSKGTLTVVGGTFDQDPAKYLPTGYVSTKIAENKYCVTKGVSTIDEFMVALENVQDGDVIALNQNIDLVETINLDGVDATIDLNGNQINASTNESRPFELNNGASLTINAEGANVECGKFGLVNMTEGTLTINGGTFENTNGNNGSFIKVTGDEEMVINLNNVTYKAGTEDSGVLRTTGSNVTVNIDGGEYEAGMGFMISNGSVKNATISATNDENMWPTVYAAGENVTVEGCTIKSACNAIAVGGGVTVTVKDCNVTVPNGKLAFQVFSSGGTIDVWNCTWTGTYGTTGKMKTGCTAIINIDGEEKFRKSAQ